MDLAFLSDQLVSGDDGIWYGVQPQAVSYPDDGNSTCFELENSSFWFQHRNQCIISAVENCPPADGEVIFDIGGGNGYVAQGLAQAGFRVALVEPGKVGAQNAKKRGIETVICATPEAAAFKSGSIGAMGLFDVIEHIEDDASFLRHMRHLMKDGGCFYATVPAYPFLWSAEDVAAGHFRRYTRKSINNALKGAGFDMEFCTYIFRPLPVAVFLQRSLPYRLGFRDEIQATSKAASDHSATGAARLALKALKSEISHIRNRKAMDFGGSLLVVARAH